jgi:hypothetical protein
VPQVRNSQRRQLLLADVVDGGETRSSYDGTTDESGRYKLYFAAGKEGAAAGAYTVHIWPPEPEDESPARAAPQLPPQYNARSEPSATVVAGSNSSEFPLASPSATLRVDRPGTAGGERPTT